MKRFFTRFLLLLAETRPCIRRFFPCLNLTFRSSSTETLADLLTYEHRNTCVKVQSLARLLSRFDKRMQLVSLKLGILV